MYLAPLNYDRFFHRVFSNIVIAKRFFEDILNVTITDFEMLPRKNKITDDAAFVEFDFRCKIEGSYYILDMQQWYKIDVVKRFYLYFCNNTSLQLENMKSVSIPLPNGHTYKTKNYERLEPTITIIWMADDNLGFKEDFVAYSIFPESMNAFMQNEELWATKSKEELLVLRREILNISSNTHRNLDFLQTNRLIFMFQPNIARNEIASLYSPWFEFASKTKNKNNVKTDFQKFSNDPIFSTMIEQLKTNIASHEDFQYIEDWDDYQIGLQNYNEKIRDEALREARIEAQAAAKAAAKAAAQAAAQAEELQTRTTARNMRQRGFSAETIADIIEVPVAKINTLFDEFDRENR